MEPKEGLSMDSFPPSFQAVARGEAGLRDYFNLNKLVKRPICWMSWQSGPQKGGTQYLQEIHSEKWTKYAVRLLKAA